MSLDGVLGWERTTLPCGYVMGVHEALVAGIPGLKSETPQHAGTGWGILRVFLVVLVQRRIYPSRTFSIAQPDFKREISSRSEPLPLRPLLLDSLAPR